MTQIIDGKKLALKIREEIARDIEKMDIQPGLAVVLVGNNPASLVYVRNKQAACHKAGIVSFLHHLIESTSEKELLSLILKLNTDKSIHGILIQLPLPRHINEKKVIEAIEPKKDVDCFHPVNVGLLTAGNPYLKPCTPAAIMELLDFVKCDPRGKRAVVIGRSNIVGKPTALLLLERHATVTICHSQTINLDEEIKRANIVIAAIGKPNFIKGSWLKKNSIVIDVGINRLANNTLVGDVEFDEAVKYASAITPVPGGVGPMTIAMLLKNTVEAAKKTMRIL